MNPIDTQFSTVGTLFLGMIVCFLSGFIYCELSASNKMLLLIKNASLVVAVVTGGLGAAIAILYLLRTFSHLLTA